MKKVIALTLALALALTNGLISFAGTISLDVNDGAFTVGMTEVILIEDGFETMKIYDANGFMEFGSIYNISGSNTYAVEVTAKRSGATVITLANTEGLALAQTGAVFIEKNPEIEESNGQEQFIVGDVNLDGKVDIFDLITLAKMIVAM